MRRSANRTHNSFRMRSSKNKGLKVLWNAQFRKKWGGGGKLLTRNPKKGLCPNERREEGSAFSLHSNSSPQPLMRRRGARTDTENIGDRPGERIGVVFLERSLVAAEHLQLDCASMHVNLCFRPAFQMLSRHEPDACRQQFLVQIMHRERRPRKEEQNPARLVLTQSGLAPFSLLLAPLVGARVFYQPQILHRGIVVLLDGFQGDSGSIQIKNVKARKTLAIARVKRRDRLILIRMAGVDMLPAAHVAQVSFLIRSKHPGVDRSRELVFLAPLAGRVSRGFSSLADANRGQFPQFGVHAQDSNSRIPRRARLAGRHISELHPRSKSLPAGICSGHQPRQKPQQKKNAEAFVPSFTGHRPQTTDHFLLNGHATCPTCPAMVWSSAAAPQSSRHRRRQNSRRRCPSLRRAAVSPWNCRMLRKLSGRRLSQICNRPPAQTTSPARIQDVLQRPLSHRVSPRSPCATHPPAQSAFRNRASVRPLRATGRRISPSPFRSSRFSPPASHNRNFRTKPHPSTQDKHFSAAWRRSRLPQLTGRESRLRDKPFHTTWPSGYTSSSQCGSSRSFARDSHSPALRPSPSSRCPRRKYVLLCWDRENPRDSRSRTPRDAAPFPAQRSRSHPQASDDTRAASCPSALPKPDPAAAAFSCARCAPANSSGPRGA